MVVCARDKGEWDDGDSRTGDRRARSNDTMNSFEANHTAVPPVSRNIVPVCPSQRPLGPELRSMLVTMVKGPGSVLRTDAILSSRLGIYGSGIE